MIKLFPFHREEHRTTLTEAAIFANFDEFIAENKWMYDYDKTRAQSSFWFRKNKSYFPYVDYYKAYITIVPKPKETIVKVRYSIGSSLTAFLLFFMIGIAVYIPFINDPIHLGIVLAVMIISYLIFLNMNPKEYRTPMNDVRNILSRKARHLTESEMMRHEILDDMNHLEARLNEYLILWKKTGGGTKGYRIGSAINKAKELKEYFRKNA